MNNVINELSDFFSYGFTQRAILVGVLISFCAALLGASLVLKRYSMIGDGLSHVGFAAYAIATAFQINNVTLKVALPVVIIAAFMLLRISDNSNIKGDSAIAIVSTVALSLGYIVMYKKGTNIDVSNYMFGNIMTITRNDAILSIILAMIVTTLFICFYHKIFAVTFDENFARGVGIKAEFYNGVIAVLTAVVVVLGMRMMGTLLISSIIIFPSLISMKICKSFRGVVILAAVSSVLCFIIGVILAHLLEIPAGSTVVLVNGLVMLNVTIYSHIKRIA